MPATSAAPFGQVFYVSRCVADPDGIGPLAEAASRRNAQRGLTGALLFTGGCFAQVLEGPADALQAMMARIEADPRHTDVRRLIDAPLEARRFGAWSMMLLEAPAADDLVVQVIADPAPSPERAERLMALLLAAAASER